MPGSSALWRSPHLAPDLLGEYGVDVADRALMRARDGRWLFRLVYALPWRKGSAVRAALAHEIAQAKMMKDGKG